MSKISISKINQGNFSVGSGSMLDILITQFIGYFKYRIIDLFIVNKFEVRYITFLQ